MLVSTCRIELIEESRVSEDTQVIRLVLFHWVECVNWQRSTKIEEVWTCLNNFFEESNIFWENGEKKCYHCTTEIPLAGLLKHPVYNIMIARPLGLIGREPAHQTSEPGLTSSWDATVHPVCETFNVLHAFKNHYIKYTVTGPITSWYSRSRQSAAGIKIAVIGLSASENTDRTQGL